MATNVTRMTDSHPLKVAEVPLTSNETKPQTWTLSDFFWATEEIEGVAARVVMEAGKHAEIAQVRKDLKDTLESKGDDKKWKHAAKKLEDCAKSVLDVVIELKKALKDYVSFDAEKDKKPNYFATNLDNFIYDNGAAFVWAGKEIERLGSGLVQQAEATLSLDKKYSTILEKVIQKGKELAKIGAKIQQIEGVRSVIKVFQPLTIDEDYYLIATDIKLLGEQISVHAAKRKGEADAQKTAAKEMDDKDLRKIETKNKQNFELVQKDGQHIIEIGKAIQEFTASVTAVRGLKEDRIWLGVFPDNLLKPKEHDPFDYKQAAFLLREAGAHIAAEAARLKKRAEVNKLMSAKNDKEQKEEEVLRIDLCDKVGNCGKELVKISQTLIEHSQPLGEPLHMTEQPALL